MDALSCKKSNKNKRMAGRVAALVDAGPYVSQPESVTDQAADKIKAIAQQHINNLINQPQPSLEQHAKVFLHEDGGVCPEPSTLELLGQFIKRLMPTNWNDFLANLIVLVIIISVIFLACRIYVLVRDWWTITSSKRSRHRAQRPTDSDVPYDPSLFRDTVFN